MLLVEDLDVSYGDLSVLFDVTINVEKGEIVAGLGSNGAGKTTILRTVSGLLRTKKGRITFQGRRIDNISTSKIVDAGVVMVPEGRQLFPLMSVRENLEMGAYSRRAREKKRENFEYVENLFPILKERKRQLAGTLSGGEQQMLAIARGLMSSPELLMLDEPSLGLAPKVVLQVFEVIRKLNDDERITVFLVEQNTSLTLNMVDRAYVIENGRIVLEGNSKELMESDHVRKAYLGQ